MESDRFLENTLRRLGQVTGCSAAGICLVEGRYGRVTLLCVRPVDDLFLEAVQQRLVSSYRSSVGPAAAEPEIEVFVHGDAVPGPYEPPRAFLASPILSAGRVVGLLAIASVLPEAFSSRDVCTLSAIAAHTSKALYGGPAPEDGGGEDLLEPDRTTPGAHLEFESRVQLHLASICGLARLWQSQVDSELPEVLRRDLDAIAERALQIRELLVR